MTQFIDTLVGIFQSSGFARFGEPGGYHVSYTHLRAHETVLALVCRLLL